mgnify:FL=1|tara:strand:+ start:90 stop:1040 length:951 start_codon:yes stop_codon:yes gene_type:complete
MSQLNFAIVGAGKSASDCVHAIERFNSSASGRHANLKLLFVDAKTPAPKISANCPVIETRNINADENVALIQAHDVDYLLSVNNHQILSAATISTPRLGVLNFHNGPLPRYGGVNVCAWAIFNGETEHGVTWHFMEPAIDAGRIIAQRRFPITARETAITLIMKCIQQGISLFEELLPSLFDGRPDGNPQDPSQRLYFSRKDIPANEIFDFSWTCEQADRYMRCLNVFPFPPALPFGKALGGERVFRVVKVNVAEHQIDSAPGTVLDIDDTAIHAALANGTISITDVIDEQGNKTRISDLVSSYGINAGANLQFRK